MHRDNTTGHNGTINQNLNPQWTIIRSRYFYQPVFVFVVVVFVRVVNFMRHRCSLNLSTHKPQKSIVYVCRARQRSLEKFRKPSFNDVCSLQFESLTDVAFTG